MPSRHTPLTPLLTSLLLGACQTGGGPSLDQVSDASRPADLAPFRAAEQPAESATDAAPNAEQEPDAKANPKTAAQKKAAQKKAAQKKKTPTLADLEKALTEKEKALALAERELGYAGADRELAEHASRRKRASAAEATRRARNTLDEAREARSAFQERTIPNERMEADLSVERATNRVEQSRTDLQGILEIYAEEVEARAKDEIIRRHRMQVTFAERELEIATGKRAIKVEVELPTKLREQSEAVRKAEADVAEARAKEEEAVMEASLDVEKKSDAVADAERAVSEAKTAADAAREKVAAKREADAVKAADRAKDNEK